MTRAHLTLVSNNGKTGPMPVSTTQSDTCPPDCPALQICYAKKGPLSWHWSKVDAGRAVTWAAFCHAISKLPRRFIWRHNQAGDLPGKGNRINAKELRQLVKANRGRRGFTYTHKKLTPANVRLITEANKKGFTINISADSPADADKKAAAAPGVPLAVIIDPATPKVSHTPGGIKIVKCPHAYRAITCQQCQLCANQRDYAIGLVEI
jgi:hypothetical protein